MRYILHIMTSCLYTESFILISECRNPIGTKPQVVMGEFTSGGFPLPDRTARAL
jgi:hypothetical protein